VRPACEVPEFVTLTEVFPRLGIDRATAYRYAKDGKPLAPGLTAVFIGGRWRVRRADLDAVLTGGAV
jgi:predicted site-specific integrase-resolvase